MEAFVRWSKFLIKYYVRGELSSLWIDQIARVIPYQFSFLRFHGSYVGNRSVDFNKKSSAVQQEIN